jgi:hypothetical protein
VKGAAVFLQHIRDAIARVEAYTAGGRRAFLKERGSWGASARVPCGGSAVPSGRTALALAALP